MSKWRCPQCGVMGEGEDAHFCVQPAITKIVAPYEGAGKPGGADAALSFPRATGRPVSHDDAPLTLTERMIHEKVREQRDVLAGIIEEVHGQIDDWLNAGTSEVDALIAIRASIDSIRWPLP